MTFAEPIITINGARLTTAEAMTVRVAISAFALDLQNGLGDDDVGKGIAEGYRRAIHNIVVLMQEPQE